MLSLVFHLGLMFAMLWHQRRANYRNAPWKLALVWYVAGAAVIAAESYAVTRLSFSVLVLQGLLLEVLYAVAAWFAFRDAGRRRKGLLRPFLSFIAYSLVATAAAGFLLAKADFVSGFVR